jgi:hypothetical protein
MNLYCDKDILPGLSEHVIFNQHSDPQTLFQTETAGMNEHPAEDVSDDGMVFMDSFGVVDPEGIVIPARAYRALALRSLNIHSAGSLSDVIISRRVRPVPEYNNPALLPGMFPTLYPFGIGGFEQPKRKVKLSLQLHANCLLDLEDKCFRYHWFFLFVVFNIMQRCSCHLHTHLTVQKDCFGAVADRLTSITPETLQAISSIIENEGKMSNLTVKQKSAFELLSYVNVISAHQPGSHASKLKCRSTIRDYMGYWGIAHVYLTINLCAAHSQIFQISFGGCSVDLTKQYPSLVPHGERAIRVAMDPIAAADFYEFCVRVMFQDLFGWDFDRHCSSEEGGILGKLDVHYSMTEVMEWGGLHRHFLLWLQNRLNPSDVHRKMEEDLVYKQYFFDFFEDTIHHHLLDIDIGSCSNTDADLRSERPLDLPPISYDQKVFDINRWNEEFLTELKRLGENF